MRTNKDESMTQNHRRFDPFADPVRYLKGLGIEAELVETREADLPSAA